jgi:hypothetical protein
VTTDVDAYESAYDSQEDYIFFQDLLARLKDTRTINPADLIDPEKISYRIIRDYVVIDSTEGFYGSLRKYVVAPERYAYRQLISDLEEILKNFKAYLRREGIEIRKQLVYLTGRLSLINNYLSSFENAGADAVKAFLDLASKDRINFAYLKKTLVEDEAKLIEILASVKDNETESLLASRENFELVKRILYNLSILSSTEGSIMESMIKTAIPDLTLQKDGIKVTQELQQNGFSIEKSIDTVLKNFDEQRMAPNKYSRYARFRLMEQSPSFEKFKEELSVLAAKIIYRKLVYATIDLGKSGAQPGDILYINVVWKNIDGEKDSTSSSLPIGKYYLRQTGWRTEISESFYLVERFNEPLNDPNIARSNFKGAYGASIMRTFYYNENYERTLLGRILNWSQPSIGFNISYLDFYNDKDIEIGAGLQLGLFKNVFFLGTGINLHSIRGDEKKSAAYFMFGVSFTNIAAKFKGKDNSTPN